MKDLDALRWRQEELRRLLDVQRDTVDALHARANMVLVVTLGVASLLAPEALGNSGLPGRATAIVFLIATAMPWCVVLYPREWTWFIGAKDLSLTPERLSADLQGLVSAAIDLMVAYADGNARRITKVGRYVRIEMVASGLAIATWFLLATP